MDRCDACGAFVPARVSACPECGSSPSLARRLGRRVAELAAGGGLVVTLMACYGMAYVPEEHGHGPEPCADPTADVDGDGYCGAQDCDEQRADVHAGAPDPAGDGLDADCDGAP